MFETVFIRPENAVWNGDVPNMLPLFGCMETARTKHILPAKNVFVSYATSISHDKKVRRSIFFRGYIIAGRFYSPGFFS